MQKQVIAWAAGAAMLLAACGPTGGGPAGQPPNPIGTVDAVASNGAGGIEVAGWAFDPNGPRLSPNMTAAVEVRVYVNGAFDGSGTANTFRPDVGAVYPSYGNNHGYAFIVPGQYGTVCVYAINFGPGTGNTTLGCRTLSPPPPPPVTVGQRNAQASALQYLSIGAFSRQGLIDQLDSPSGSGYSVADATYGVDSLNVDWNSQAVKAALEYISCCGPWSRQGLIDQLDSPSGSEFTVAQATYGVTATGL